MKHTIKGKLTTVEIAIQYIQNGEVLLGAKSTATGNKFVYSIKESLNGKRFFVNLIAVTGEQGFMGVILEGNFQRTEKSRVSEQSSAFKAFAWIWASLSANKMPPGVELYAVE